MAQGMGIPSGVTISGVELTSITCTGKVDTLVIEADSEKSAPQQAFAYNAVYELSFEGIDTGFSESVPTATAFGKTFKITSATKTATAGDFKKVSGRGVFYPNAG